MVDVQLATRGEINRTVLVVSGDQVLLDGMARLFQDHRVLAARNVTQAEQRIVEDRVDLVIFDSSFATVAGVKDGGMLLDVDPELPLVLMTDTPDMSVLRTALRSGFADVVDAPLDRAKADGMLRLIRDHERRAHLVEAKPRLGKIVTIFSPKGGAGKTMTSANVALQLAMWSDPGRVVIVDADLQFGDVCISMQVDPDHTIVEAATDVDQLDFELLDGLLSTHKSGLRILAGPLEPALADKVSTQAMVRILGLLKHMFDYVVIDTAPFLDEPVLSILERSDEVLLVVEMDVPAVKNVKLALDTLKLLDFPLGKIQLVLNRYNSKARLDVGELERTLELEVQAAIASNKLVPRAVNEGEPVVSLYPRSRVARDLRAVARLVFDEEDSPEPPEDEGRRRWWA
jgi:pilus assembly protein CpaE